MALALKKKPQVFNPKAQKNNKDFYNTQSWRGKNGLRAMRLFADPYCVACGMSATMVDHVVPINAGGDPLDYDNTQSMCDSCHNFKRNIERHLYA